MSRTRSLRNRDEIYRALPSEATRTYTVSALWPNGRTTQLRQNDKDQAREAAEELELKGARVTVVEWNGSQFRQLAVLDAFAKRRQLPSGATHAHKVAAIKADLATLARQTAGRQALQ